MSIAILATGNEIVQGDTPNSNGQNIAKALASDGMPVGLHMSCTDQETEIYDCLRFLSHTHSVIIVIGGLGPTSDDRTRIALAEFTQTQLVEYHEALIHIESRLKRANLQMNEGNRQQALFPPEVTLLPNPNGTAMGCIFNKNNQRIILLPGPPRECLPMFMEHVLPVLKMVFSRTDPLLKWLLLGVAEGEIAGILDAALVGIQCEIGYRLDTPYVEFKVRCKSEQVKEVEQIITDVFTKHHVVALEEKASKSLRARLETISQPLGIVDEVTGGHLQTLIQTPATHRTVLFQACQTLATVFHITGLEAYWKQEEKKQVQIMIQYTLNHQSMTETLTIPYRGASPLILLHAAEWLCLRLLQLINQMH